MQHETSNTHAQNLASGLNVEWSRSTGHTDADFCVVCYSDKSRWLFDNGSAEKLTLLGEVKDGLNKAEVLETSNGAIVALYAECPQSFAGREDWLDSMPEADKPEAIALLEGTI